MTPDELLATARDNLLRLRSGLHRALRDSREAADVHARVALACALREVAVAQLGTEPPTSRGGYAHA